MIIHTWAIFSWGNSCKRKRIDALLPQKETNSCELQDMKSVTLFLRIYFVMAKDPSMIIIFY